MKPLWQALAWGSGAVGAAVTGAAVGVATHSTRAALRRKSTDPYADEVLGQLPSDRRSTVAADDGIPLSVQEIDPAEGEAELTVLLVHGFTLDSRSWHFQRRDLPEMSDPRVRLVLFDLRSHGRSGHSSKRTSTIDQLGRDLDAVLRATVRSGPVVLVGHSMGGMAIMALAAQRPELFRDHVRGVAFVGSSCGEVGSSGLPRPVLSRSNPLTRGLGVLADLQPALVERTRKVGDRITWNVIRTLAFGDRSISPTVVDLMADMIGSTSVEVITDFLETISTHSRKDALAALRHCEVLVLSGDADRLTPYVPHAEVIAGELPDAELVRVAGAGHLVILECPELVTEHIAALVRRSYARKRTARRRKVAGS
ncbi:alpha/beta hydrolase [Saccharopolyspora sp. HNM0983]|uniref:Alpha/beta hydrolase n=1 Tax=Saccharopolyspora montiporae TaxID=2781240 RepID=A0A929BCD3_9PSEU|nr:alpha/beta hydrolase [Saccharopolyspora sp. HNM0983]MBE9375033.1 alpha/beta hydrolase [Saccharopolyspora sp. HNM0983]